MRQACIALQHVVQEEICLVIFFSGVRIQDYLTYQSGNA